MPEASLEYNDFKAGLVTEVSEINSPDTSIREILNFDLMPDGSAELRAPLRREVNSPSMVDVTGATYSAPVSSFVWHAPDGDTDNDLVFLQYGSVFKVYRRPVGIGSTWVDITPSTATHCTDGAISATATFQPNVVASVAQRLHYSGTQSWCAVTGLEFDLGSETAHEMVGIFTYDKDAGTLTAEYDFLWVRDFWGVEDGRVDGKRTPASAMTQAIAYNLFNQGWGNFVDGAKPASYVINKFYADSALANTTAVLDDQVLSGYATINGTDTIGGVAYLEQPGPVLITYVRTSGPSTYFAGNTVFIGTDLSGQPATETVSYALDGTSIDVQTTTSWSTITSVYHTNLAGSAVSGRCGSGSAYPGDRDNWTLGVAAAAGSKSYNAKYVVQSPDITSSAPKGNYIIPAHYRSYDLRAYDLSRASSASTYSRVFGVPSAALASDRSGRPHSTASWAGRAWYGTSLDGCASKAVTSASPSIGGYIFFSRVVKKAKDMVSCYQANNPTSPDISDIMADDGGFVYIPELGALRSVVPLGGMMLVLASNGVWGIVGDRDAGFSATGYSVAKLASRGCVAEDSVLTLGDVVLYMSSAGVEMISAPEGSPVVQSMTDEKNGKYVRELAGDFSAVKAVFDYTSSKARFLVDTNTELVLSFRTGATEVHVFDPGTDSILGYVQMYGDFVHKFSGSDITAPSYLYLLKDSDDVIRTGQLRYDDANGELFQWEDIGGPYGDNSYLVLAHIVAGESKLIKRAPFITAHFRRTEDAAIVSANGDARLRHPSGCTISAYWGWADSATSPLRAAEFQAYRLTRAVAPPSTEGTHSYAYGQSVITSRSALRGYGRALSISFHPEDNKDCKILGWAVPVKIPYNQRR